MKKSILSMAIVALLFAGCGNETTQEHTHDSEGNHIHGEGVHQHEDGSIHEDHDDEHHQEEFKVGGDSSAVKTEKEHGHSHDDGGHKH